MTLKSSRNWVAEIDPTLLSTYMNDFTYNNLFFGTECNAIQSNTDHGARNVVRFPGWLSQNAARFHETWVGTLDHGTPEYPQTTKTPEMNLRKLAPPKIPEIKKPKSSQILKPQGLLDPRNEPPKVRTHEKDPRQSPENRMKFL